MGRLQRGLLLMAGLLLALPLQAKGPQQGDDGAAASLPPGLQKKVERGGRLPPGWERKLQVGKPLDAELYRRSQPVSDSVRARLPAGDAGTIEVRLEGKVVRLYKATREIVSVFDIDGAD